MRLSFSMTSWAMLSLFASKTGWMSFQSPKTIFIEKNAVIMMGAILNIGAVVGEGTMIDMGVVLGTILPLRPPNTFTSLFVALAL